MRYVLGALLVLVIGCGSEVEPVGDAGEPDAALTADAGEPCDGEPPTPAHLCCGGEWADVVNDAENCGGCGLACTAGAACGGGVCD